MFFVQTPCFLRSAMHDAVDRNGAPCRQRIDCDCDVVIGIDLDIVCHNCFLIAKDTQKMSVDHKQADISKLFDI